MCVCVCVFVYDLGTHSFSKRGNLISNISFNYFKLDVSQLKKQFKSHMLCKNTSTHSLYITDISHALLFEYIRSKQINKNCDNYFFCEKYITLCSYTRTSCKNGIT